MICFACGESDTEVFGSSGNSVCTKCGTVLEENAIVSEISFGETSGGAAMVQGSYVGADQTRARAPAGYRQKVGGTESREQTIANGRRKIQTLALGLNIADRLSDTAQRYFNLAVNMKFVQGRRTQYVVAAVLYCACRMDKTSHMLIDFSDILEINVFVLGSTYLKLVKELNLQLPSVDPSLYISRFAALLEFGEETQKVAADATRLVSRMSRDWMNTGRRPAGVCGACLLLAARMNNFRRSVTEVVQVVKIADVTLRKRLAEFKDTPSGKLTVSDFRTLWLDEVADPPAFSKNQKIERLAREREEEVKRLNRAESGVGSDGEEEDDDQMPGEKEAFEELAAGKEPGSGAIEEEDEDEEDAIMAPPPKPSAKALGKRKSKRNRDASEDNDSADEGLGDEHEELDEAIANEVGATLDSETGKILVTELDMAEKRRINTASSMTNLNSMTDLNTSERLDDLDEDELDMFILTETEVAAKSRLWMEFNKQYLQELADKQTGPDGELKPAVARRIRKKHKPRDSTNAAGTNAADATKQMLTKKRFSKKINYAAIDNLFGTPSKKKVRSDGEEASGDEEEEEDGDSFMVGMNATPTVTPGTPIHIPAPNWKNPSRSGTPVRSTARANSIVPEAVVPAEEEEEYAAAPVEEEEEEQEEWQRMLTQGKGGEEEEEDGYGEDAGY